MLFFEDPLLISQTPWQNMGLCGTLEPGNQGCGADLWAPKPEGSKPGLWQTLQPWEVLYLSPPIISHLSWGGGWGQCVTLPFPPACITCGWLDLGLSTYFRSEPQSQHLVYRLVPAPWMEEIHGLKGKGGRESIPSLQSLGPWC